jgi:peptidoglycan/xylan/chitin deacetylase (PgdA/CDA1 family)
MKTIFITLNSILALFLSASIASAVDNINNQATKKSLCIAENITKKSWDLVNTNLAKTISNSAIKSDKSLNFSQAEGSKKDIPFSPQLIASCLPNINQANNSNPLQSSSLCRLVRQQVMAKSPAKTTKTTTNLPPPQFVLLAFDGSQSLDAWQRSRQFAKDMEKKGIFVRFTYFISGVYFVTEDNRKMYNAPAGKGVGRSAIGWAKSADDIAKRLEQVNLAYQEGHEIGSHAVGHFNGSNWSEADWQKEFAYFNQFIFDAYQNNNLTGNLAFDQKAIQGFRAPELGHSKGLYQTLTKQGFRYDTSKTNNIDYWPQKINQVWNFPLVSLTTAKTKKRTLSMDYNFYMAHSQAKPNKSQAELYEQDMFETYLKYFENNYAGNRSPIHIGHHFSEWNNGAYWRSLFRFAEKVCGRPEVKCVTYQELADFMDTLTPAQIAIYQKSDFSKKTKEKN